MVLLKFLAQAFQNGHRLFDSWFAHVNLLKPAFECRILLDAFTILVQRRGADHLELAAGQRLLEHVGGIDGTLGSSGSH